MRHLPFLALILLGILTFSPFAHAEETYVITLKDGQFSPQELEIPANQKVKIIVKNMDPKSIEFESHDFNREKIMPPKSEAKIFVGPLKPGKYGYFDEFHPASTGALVVK